MSASLLVFAPLRVEAAALKEAPQWRVLRSGMGMQRARIAAARGMAVESAQALAVVGLCAGVSPELRVGDIVCATELRCEGARCWAPRGGAAAGACTPARSSPPTTSSGGRSARRLQLRE